MSAVGWGDLLRREPYRLLFPLGVVFGCLGVAHWLSYGLGIADASAHYHASVQIGAYLYCFITGFLWTALPRMAGVPAASRLELSLLLTLLAAQIVLLALGHAMFASLCFTGLLILLVFFAVRRMRTRQSTIQGPTSFIWVPIGAGFGIIGAGLLVADIAGVVPAWLAASGRVMSQQGFPLSVVVGVAGFMAPRLAGYTIVRQRYFREHLFAAGLLGVSFLIEGCGFIRAAYILRAATVTLELSQHAPWWKAPVVKDFYVRMLWLSLRLIVIGLWAVACLPLYRVAMLHLVLIGGFSLMIFAMGTMVVLSHAGQAEALRRPLWVLRVAAVGTIGATVARILADLWHVHFFALLVTASLFWLIAGVAWFLFILPWVWRALPEGAFERMHEQAKKRLLREQAAQNC